VDTKNELQVHIKKVDIKHSAHKRRGTITQTTKYNYKEKLNTTTLETEYYYNENTVQSTLKKNTATLNTRIHLHYTRVKPYSFGRK
jgi:hypothetical protein